jgi:AcrR family transcriptional regulator
LASKRPLAKPIECSLFSSPMERRTELLRAAARVYAKYGYRGSTTRRIADEARVNEVTIFRQFGSKDALIHEAIATWGGVHEVPDLPTVPVDPVAELTAWGTTLMQHMRDMQSMFRRCLSEQEEHPQLAASVAAGPVRASNALRAYLGRLREHGFTDQDCDVKAMSAMFISALFTDAVGRGTMPDIFSHPVNAAGEAYARLLLRAVGVVQEQPTLT